MSIYFKQTELILPITLQEAWDFFSNPRNLARITPEEMGFTITSPHLEEKMHPGMIITYTVKPLLGIPITWVTEITQVDAGRSFVDEQRFGPYRFWHHRHTFEAVEGGVRCRDVLHYAVPGWFLSAIVNKLMVRNRLDAIFAYREKVLREIFPAA